MKRLVLPGGGYFDIPMPKGGRFVQGPLRGLSGTSLGATKSVGGKIAVIGIGAALGAFLTWVLIEVLD